MTRYVRHLLLTAPSGDKVIIPIYAHTLVRPKDKNNASKMSLIDSGELGEYCVLETVVDVYRKIIE